MADQAAAPLLDFRSEDSGPVERPSITRQCSAGCGRPAAPGLAHCGQACCDEERRYEPCDFGDEALLRAPDVPALEECDDIALFLASPELFPVVR